MVLNRVPVRPHRRLDGALQEEAQVRNGGSRGSGRRRRSHAPGGVGGRGLLPPRVRSVLCRGHRDANAPQVWKDLLNKLHAVTSIINSDYEICHIIE